MNEAVWTGKRIMLVCIIAGMALGGSFSSLVTIITTMLIISFVPIVMVRTYDVSPMCFLRFPPMLPAGVADDIFDIFNTTIFPRHLPWPEVRIHITS